MSDKPISVGDLVQVVKACKYCGDASDLGYVFRVRTLEYNHWPMECCNHSDESQTATRTPDWGSPLWCLKRIPPLSELEGQRTEEKLKVPA